MPVVKPPALTTPMISEVLATVVLGVNTIAEADVIEPEVAAESVITLPETETTVVPDATLDDK